MTAASERSTIPADRTEHSMTDDDLNLPTPDDDDTPYLDDLLTTEHDRHDYLASDGWTIVHQFTFADGTGLKAWSQDEGRTYTTRTIDTDGAPSLKSTINDMSVDQVNDLVDAYAEALETSRA
jgi:hypothetical protein